MAMALKLIRRPRTRKTPEIIRRELRAAYAGMANDIERAFQKWFSSHDWRVSPKVIVRIRVTGRTYVVSVHIDRRSKDGKIFFWVDLGTMDEGDPATTYPIEPINAPLLVFDVPYQPKSMPSDGVLNYDPSAEPRTLRMRHVDHPGIKPRHISQEILAVFKDRKNRRGFYRITENAYRRGFRRAKKAGQV